MRICIDIDGVICELRKDNESYAELAPITGAVEKIKQLKSAGHTIILYTARRMKTHKANVGKVVADIGLITLNWLRENDIPYDEIFFGKPWADIYIDDNALRFENWLSINNDGSNLPKSQESKLIK